jgi:hypothetical protein
LGASCIDGDVCNGDEICDGFGFCAAGVPPVIDDNNACTTDSCDPVLGTSHVPVAGGTSCSDGDVCTGDELCDALGNCLPGQPIVVTDGDPCTIDSCDPNDGTVSHTPTPAGASCSDGNPCNGDETCSAAGICELGAPPIVDDGIGCTLDVCDPVEGIKHHACSDIDRTVASTLFETTSFLFTGADPIQKGVIPGAIDPLRMTVLRGTVTDVSGQPLPGVTVSVLGLDPNEPDCGFTASQANGLFDLACNGGGTIAVAFEKDGFLCQCTVTCKRHGTTTCACPPS